MQNIKPPGPLTRALDFAIGTGLAELGDLA